MNAENEVTDDDERAEADARAGWIMAGVSALSALFCVFSLGFTLGSQHATSVWRPVVDAYESCTP